LRVILEQNFLRFDGRGSVPSQIHSYLSTNFKELRSLAKDDPSLIAKAADRWYVPDPSKQIDLEKLRERSLLTAFETYKQAKERKLKLFRTEAVRAGFKSAYEGQDYKTIVSVAAKLPENVLQEDEKLLMYYDVASMRLGDE
jgi:DNA polymerase I-like protein with 3'-5' exonuclease and polymerase domains